MYTHIHTNMRTDNRNTTKNIHHIILWQFMTNIILYSYMYTVYYYCNFNTIIHNNNNATQFDEYWDWSATSRTCTEHVPVQFFVCSRATHGTMHLYLIFYTHMNAHSLTFSCCVDLCLVGWWRWLWLGCGMSCGCGWDKLCSGGRAATVEILYSSSIVVPRPRSRRA